VPQVQYSDRVVDVPVVQQRQVPSVQKAQKTGEVPQVQHTDRVVRAECRELTGEVRLRGGASIGKGAVPGQFQHDLEGGGASLLDCAGIGKGAFPYEVPVGLVIDVPVPRTVEETAERSLGGSPQVADVLVPQAAEELIERTVEVPVPPLFAH